MHFANCAALAAVLEIVIGNCLNYCNWKFETLSFCRVWDCS